MFAGSLWLARLLPTGFTPPTDNGIIQMTLESAPGAILAIETLTQLLARRAEVDLVFAALAAGYRHQ